MFINTVVEPKLQKDIGLRPTRSRQASVAIRSYAIYEGYVIKVTLYLASV